MVVGPHLALLVLHNLETLDEAAAAHVSHTREPGGGDIMIWRLLSVQQAAAHLSRRLRRERRSCFPIMLAELIIFSLLITSRTCIPDMEQNQSNFTNYIYPRLHTNSTSHGVAPECGEVSAEPVPHLLAADHRAHREPVTQALDSIDM